MSLTEYEDPIILLARDPDLNKEQEKTAELIRIIGNFPPTERKVSKLCLALLAILQSLEKIELQLKNWAFMSLDINSEDHFDAKSGSSIHNFNSNVATRVLGLCRDINRKLNQIAADIDYITSVLKTLSVIEYLLDSGTLLTSLTLRNIKLKDLTSEKVTVAYLKALLISIGTQLEEALNNEVDDTTATYKQFVVSLMKQLNNAIETEDLASKFECLAVISDMEKMFEAWKLERAQQTPQQEDHSELERFSHSTPEPFSAADSRYDSDDESLSTSLSSYNPPVIHSITKASPELDSSLHKTTISSEMPFLMSAFSSARNFEEDVSHYAPHLADRKPKTTPAAPTQAARAKETKRKPQPRPVLHHKTNLPDSSLYSESQILQPLTASLLYSNQSLLAKLGIKPQVIEAEIPADEKENTTKSKHHQQFVPLTSANLLTHNSLEDEVE
jgi:hypothetical protein